MIRRTFDPSFLNEVVNDPSVRPWVAGEGELDVTVAVTNPANYALVTDGGGFILMSHGDGVYEVHSQFLESARRRTIAAMRAGFEYMFCQTDCVKVITQIPHGNPAAAALGVKAGFRELFSGKGPKGPASFAELTIGEWAARCSALEEDGAWFHRLLEGAKAENGSELPVHDDDQAHDRFVGAAVKMVRAGNAAKAVGFYNSWAKFAGYAEISLLSEHPITIDVVDAVLEFSGGKVEVLLCR